jgi:hypothetical protein
LGDSVLIDGVALSLEKIKSTRVIRLQTPGTEIRERLVHLKPDLVVFELDSPYAPSIMSLLCDPAATTLIGLDLTCSRTIVVNSYPHTTHNMDELAQLIQAKAIPSSPPCPPG